MKHILIQIGDLECNRVALSGEWGRRRSGGGGRNEDALISKIALKKSRDAEVGENGGNGVFETEAVTKLRVTRSTSRNGVKRLDADRENRMGKVLQRRSNWD